MIWRCQGQHYAKNFKTVFIIWNSLHTVCTHDPTMPHSIQVQFLERKNEKKNESNVVYNNLVTISYDSNIWMFRFRNVLHSWNVKYDEMVNNTHTYKEQYLHMPASILQRGISWAIRLYYCCLILKRCNCTFKYQPLCPGILEWYVVWLLTVAD